MRINEAKLYYSNSYPKELLPKRNVSGQIEQRKSIKIKKDNPFMFKTALEARNSYSNNYSIETLPKKDPYNSNSLNEKSFSNRSKILNKKTITTTTRIMPISKPKKAPIRRKVNKTLRSDIGQSRREGLSKK